MIADGSAESFGLHTSILLPSMHAHQLAQARVPDGSLSEKEDGQYHSDRLSLPTPIRAHDLLYPD